MYMLTVELLFDSYLYVHTYVCIYIHMNMVMECFVSNIKAAGFTIHPSMSRMFQCKDHFCYAAVSLYIGTCS